MENSGPGPGMEAYQRHHMPDVVQRCGAGDSLPVGQYPEMTEAVQYGEDDGRRLLYTKHTHKGPLSMKLWNSYVVLLERLHSLPHALILAFIFTAPL